MRQGLAAADQPTGNQEYGAEGEEHNEREDQQQLSVAVGHPRPPLVEEDRLTLSPLWESSAQAIDIVPVMPKLTQDGPVWTLDLGSDENRFSSEWLDEAEALLDEVENSNEPVALVTIGSGKFYSNGLALDWLLANPEQAAPYSQRVQRLLARMLTLPVPTVAAINGHAFGAGAMFAMAHDHRVMRADRGYFCFPEVDIGIPFTPGMAALIMSKLTPRAAIDSMTTGRRFGGEDAHATGLVDAACSLEELPETASALIRERAGKDRGTLGAIKNTMFAEAASALRDT